MHAASDHFLHSTHCTHFSFSKLLLNNSKHTTQKQSSSSELLLCVIDWFSLPLLPGDLLVFFSLPFPFADGNFMLPFSVSGWNICFLALFLWLYSSSKAPVFYNHFLFQILDQPTVEVLYLGGEKGIRWAEVTWNPLGPGCGQLGDGSEVTHVFDVAYVSISKLNVIYKNYL